MVIGRFCDLGIAQLSFNPLCSEVKFTQSCPTLCNPMDYTVHGILQARTLEWRAFPFSGGSSQPRDRTRVSCIADGFLPAEPQGKPKNTGVGKQIFLTQESNQGLLHCRQIFYQLSYQGSQIMLGRSKYKSFPGSFRGLCYRGLQPWEDFSSQWIVLKPPSVPAEWW